MVGKVYESNIIFLCVRLSMRPSICLSYYLLNHRAEFNQTCCITSLHGKVLREQRYFPCVRPCVRRPSICSSRYLLLNYLAEFNQTCYITCPYDKSVQEHHYFSVRSASVQRSVTLSPPKPLGRIQPNMLHHVPLWLGCARATLFFCPFGVRPSVRHVIFFETIGRNLTKLGT